MSRSPDAAAPAVNEALDTGEEVNLRMRPAGSLPGRVAFWFGVALSLFHIWMNTLGTWPELWQACFHFAGFGFLCALLYPAFTATTDRGRRWVLGLDVVLGLGALSLFAYLYFNELSFYSRQQTTGFAWYDWLFTGIALLLAIEFTRRTTGWVIPILIILSFTYVTLWGRWVPGMLTFAGLRSDTMLFRIFYTDDGMFGTVGRISSSYVFMFILFGAFLLRSGAGHFIIDFAQVLARRMVGGPGLVAVIGSGLMGTISGSAVANTVSTGTITIPLMKRAGMPAQTAAATEAAASTGGQIMPPIMGAGAFVMASFTQVPYLTIAAVSVIPAILYFVSIAFYVRITAKRLNLKPQTDEVTKTLGQVLRENGLAFFVPIGVLVGLMIWGYTPTYAAGFAILAVIVASWLTKNPMGPRAVLEALALGARNMVMTAVLLIAIGVVITAVTLSGVGNTFSLMIDEWSGGSVLIAIMLIALASLVLGMGLPVTAAYIVVATLSAPALADMILRSEVIDMIAMGTIGPGPGAMLMLGSPQHAAAIGQPMDAALAAQILSAAPIEFSRMITEQSLAPQAITAAFLAAHLIVFWLSQDSSVTPPVCLTAFAAAAIAGSRPMATGFTAWKMAKGLYIVPLLFAFSPLLSGTIWQQLEIALFTIAALYALAAAFEGHMEAPIGWPMRVVLLGLCAVLIWPVQEWEHYAALVVFGVLLAWNVRQDRAAA
ncbi:TRAP transporter permease [Pararhodobacter zhoushanensis]|uniref:TRAP transporter fused permease subunit n=1 Tax=Pararhodobacter zhoushanensis TaxID=2479545 RepID=A0ABT3GV12_9RHOB|nr:TRAP transporter fused permease subunit [Pararhodobacter zhoushanensis]MCW1931377.1 TRAP transporter fused permease subunit [Pararhodobacter zhoushanensis]